MTGIQSVPAFKLVLDQSRGDRVMAEPWQNGSDGRSEFVRGGEFAARS